MVRLLLGFVVRIAELVLYRYVKVQRWVRPELQRLRCDDLDLVARQVHVVRRFGEPDREFRRRIADQFDSLSRCDFPLWVRSE